MLVLYSVSEDVYELSICMSVHMSMWLVCPQVSLTQAPLRPPTLSLTLTPSLAVTLTLTAEEEIQLGWSSANAAGHELAGGDEADAARAHVRVRVACAWVTKLPDGRRRMGRAPAHAAYR